MARGPKPRTWSVTYSDDHNHEVTILFGWRQLGTWWTPVVLGVQADLFVPQDELEVLMALLTPEPPPEGGVSPCEGERAGLPWKGPDDIHQ